MPDGFDQVRFEPLSEAQIAEHLASLGGGFGALEVDQEFRLSIAGAQEKTAVLRHGGQWCRPLGATPTTHILKPAIGVVPHWHYDLSESVANEWLCARLLAELGFAVADSSIETFGGQQVLCVERFDRAWTAQGWIARLPQEDFRCAALPAQTSTRPMAGPACCSACRCCSMAASLPRIAPAS